MMKRQFLCDCGFLLLMLVLSGVSPRVQSQVLTTKSYDKEGSHSTPFSNLLLAQKKRLNAMHSDALSLRNEESQELLKDPFMYEFDGNKPSSYDVVGATIEKLEDRRRYSSDTGFAVQLTTEEEEGYIRQEIPMGKNINVGDLLQGTIHYYSEKTPHTIAPLRLACQWLDANGSEIMNAEEKALLHNEKLFFGRNKAWGEFSFRTVVPEGAAKFILEVRVMPKALARFDDFSLIRLADKDKTPFVSILPQYMTVEGASQQTKEMEVAFQTNELANEQEITFTGHAGDLAIAEFASLAENTTKRGTLRFTPSKKGVFTMGKPGAYKVTLAGAQQNASLLLTAYVVDASNPPVVTVNETLPIKINTQNGVLASKTISVDASGIIESVTAKLEQEETGAFRINTGLLYYSASKDKLLNNQIRIDFQPTETKTYHATLVLTSPLAQELRIPIEGKVLSEDDKWIEKFTAKQKNDARFQGEKWSKYNKFDKGYWQLDGSWISQGKISINPGGYLLYDDFIYDGIETLSLATTSEICEVQYSINGGASWTKADKKGKSYEIATHRPTLFRVHNTASEAVEVSSIELLLAQKEDRIVFDDIDDALVFPDQEPLALLNEDFNAQHHTRILMLDGWQNIIFSGDRAFKGWEQKDKDGNKEEDCAQISFYSYSGEDKSPYESSIISPWLSYKQSKSKILTFRLRYELPTEGGQETFSVFILTKKEGVYNAQPIDLTRHIAVKNEVMDATWYDYSIDLSKSEEVQIDDIFAVVFSFHSPVGGKESTLSFMIDDVSYGRTDLPVLNVDKTLLNFEFKPKVEAQPQTINVTSERATAPITVLLHAPHGSSHFVVSPQKLPTQGGSIVVGFKSDVDKSEAAMLLIQTKGAVAQVVKLLAQIKSAAIEVESGMNIVVFPTVAEDALHVRGEYKSFELFDAEGKRITQGEGRECIDIQHLSSGNYFLRLTIENKKDQTIYFHKK